MRKTWKMIALTAIVSTLAASIVAWRAQTGFAKASLERARAMSESETSAVRRTARARLESLRAEVIREAAAREATGKSSLASNSAFEIVALAKPTESAGWHLAWAEKSRQAAQSLPHASQASRWAGGFDATLLAGLPFDRVRDGVIVWLRLADAKGEAAFAMLFEADLGSTPDAAVEIGSNSISTLPEHQALHAASLPRRSIVAAVFAGDPLASVVGPGSAGTAAFLVDDKGFVAAHSNKQYLGASFASDGLVSEALSKRRPSGAGEFKDVDGKLLIGRFEAVSGTNLYAVYAATSESVMSAASTSTRSALALGLGCVLSAVGLCAAFMGGSVTRSLTGGDSSAAQAPGASASAVRERGCAAGSIKTAHELGLDLVAPSVARADALQDGIGTALRGPLAAIIGNAQLARRKVSEPEARAHMEAIERDARQAMDSLERFSRLAEPEPARLAPVTVADALEAALASNAAALEAVGATIVRRYDDAPSVLADAGLLQSAFARAIENSAIAMSGRTVRVLTVSIEADDGLVRVRIVDTGAGMSRDVRERAFEPFFKAFEGSGRLGLGLAFARHAFDLFSASASFESSPGEGAQLTVEFPLLGEVSAVAAGLINMKRVEAVHDLSFIEEPTADELEFLDLAQAQPTQELHHEPEYVAEPVDIQLAVTQTPARVRRPKLRS